MVLGVLLFIAYLAQARTIPGTSEGGGQAIQAWEMLHGNLLLHGWTMSDVSFYTTELPEYMLVEWIHGLNADTVHVAAALSYTLIVLLGGLLAKGQATGREGLIRFFIAAGIMLAPPLSNTSLLLGDPDHTGTHVPLLLILLVLDRAPRRWWTPVLITVMLTWAQVGDTIVLYEAAIPIGLAGLAVANLRRGALAANWFDLSLAAGVAISAVAARLILTLIRDSGGFIVEVPDLRFTTPQALQQGIFTDVSRMLEVFGARFSGLWASGDASGTLIKVIGLVLVVWGAAAGVRRLYRLDTDIVVQVLTLGFVILVGGYVLGTKNDVNEIVGLLPLGTVLAGRVLTAPVIRNKLVLALAVVLVLSAGMLGGHATRPPYPGPGNRARGLAEGPRPDLRPGQLLELDQHRGGHRRRGAGPAGAHLRRPGGDHAVGVVQHLVRPAPALRELHHLGPLVAVRRGLREPGLGPAELRAAAVTYSYRQLAHPGLQQEPAGPAAHRQLVQ